MKRGRPKPQHNPENWAQKRGIITAPPLNPKWRGKVTVAVAQQEGDMVEANAQRIVDCVNACMGIPEPKPPQRLALSKPKSGQPVIWLWEFAGQATAGDYYKGKPRDAAKNYEVIKDILPSHWIAWPNDWLSAKPVA